MEKHLTPHNAWPSLGEGLTKKQVAMMADRSVSNLLEEGDVVSAAEALAAMDEFIRLVRRDERYVQFLRDELAKHHGQFLTASGAKIESCESGVRYDYGHSAEWQELNEAIVYLNTRKKKVEEKLRSVAPGRMAVDTETGEVTEGAGKSSRSTYRITLAK